jgi:hypothetical protein
MFSDHPSLSEVGLITLIQFTIAGCYSQCGLRHRPGNFQGDFSLLMMISDNQCSAFEAAVITKISIAILQPRVPRNIIWCWRFLPHYHKTIDTLEPLAVFHGFIQQNPLAAAISPYDAG